MTKIPLRSYTREIESLIERGMTEEALGHCRFILKNYPKHIDTYKLLGKAFLESQRYSEAADILQRILSVYPDDFFAQIGMSIIREDEGNLDAAIFHMERAYEAQPANIAVHDEMRRLYGRRDGVEPPKLRLSRGALVRMYARGGLNQQAVAEIQSVLSDDPHRLDLEVILAKIYYTMGNHAQAAETASKLCDKLPYCFEANFILANILPTTPRAEDAQQYLERLISLDPYIAYLSPSSPSSIQVPDNAVMIDRYEWQPSESTQNQPAWAQSLGIRIEEETEPQPTPTWLTEPHAHETPPEGPTHFPIQSGTGALTPTFLSEDAKEEPAIEAELPDWMKNAGWEVTSQPSSESPAPVFTELEETTTGEDLSQAEIPEWIKNLAPASLDGEASEAEREKLNLLDQILPPTSETAQPEAAIAPENPQAQASVSEIPDMPDWLKTFSAEHLEADDKTPSTLEASLILPPEELIIPIEPEPPTDLSEASPQSLSDLSALVTPEEIDSDTFTAQEAAPSAEAPSQEEDWFATLAAMSPSLEEIPAAQPSVESEKEAPFTASAETPTEDWFASLQATAEKETETTEDNLPLPAWLTEPESTITVPPADQTEILSETPLTELPVSPELSAEITETPQAEAVFDLSNLSVTDLQEAPPMPPVEILSEQQETIQEDTIIFPSAEANATLLTADAATEAPTEELQTELVSSESPEFLQIPSIDELHPVEPVAGSEIGEMVTQEQDSSPHLPDLSDPDAALAWLEALAVKQGADEETLITKPEDRTQTPPDWISELAAASSEPVAQETVSLVGGPTAEGSQLQTEESKISMIEDVFDIPEPAILEAVADQAPEPLVLPISQDQETEPQAAATAEAPKEMDFNSAFAWLESLAAQQGAEAETLITAPSERPESPPDWVREEDTQQADSPTQPVHVAPVEPAVVDSLPLEPPQDIAVPSTLSVEEEVIVPHEEPAMVQNVPTQSIEPEAVFPPQVETAPEVEPLAPVHQTSSLGPLPEWLKGVEDQPQPISDDDSAKAPDLPDWLRGIESEATPPTQQAPEPSAEPLPDWITSQAQPTPQPPIPPTDSGQPSPAAPVPDWVREMELSQDSTSTSDKTTGESQVIEDALPQYDENEPIPAGTESPNMTLNQAQTSLASGKVEISMRYYARLIQNGLCIEDSIHDLRDALYRFPVDIQIWQTLGDAYLRNNQIQEALDAYTKAEEFLR